MRWEEATLRKLVKIKNGKDHKKLHDGIYPVYGSGGIIRHVDKFLYNKESVLLPRKGTLNNIQFANEPFWTVDTCYYTEVNTNKVIPYFLYSSLQRFDILSLNTGAAVPSMTFDKYYSIKIEVPPLETQQKIVEILSAYDSLIENNNKQIKLLEEAASRLYKEWFVNFRFPGHQNVKIVNGVPEGWREAPICEIISFLNGYAFKSKEFSDDSKYKIATIKNVQDGYFNPNPANGIDKIPEKMAAHCKLKKGDILLSLTGNVGRVCIVHCEGFLLNQRVAKLESNYKSFTYCLFRNSNFARQIKNLANGTAQKNLSPIKAGQIKFVKPPEELLNRFEDVSSLCFQHILMLKSQIELASEARDRLLPKLMSREIEV